MDNNIQKVTTQDHSVSFMLIAAFIVLCGFTSIILIGIF